MKNKIKFISFILLTVMLLNIALVACTPTSTDDSTDAPSSDITDTPTEAPTQSGGNENSTEDSTEGSTEGSTDGSTEGSTENDYVMPEDEYRLPKEEGYNQITFYWTYDGGSYENCDTWVWWDGKEGSGYPMYECNYGGKTVINVPVGIDQVGFIIRRDCSEPGGSSWGQATKDYDGDRFAVLDADGDTFIYLKSGDFAQYESNDGGKTLVQIKKFTLAGILDLNTIQYSLTPALKINSVNEVKLLQGDKEIAISAINTLGREAESGKITTTETLDISKPYSIYIEGYGEKPVVPTKIFDSTYFKENFLYDGNDLGSIINGSNTTFKVWAPTASEVVLDLYTSGHEGEAYKKVSMTRGDKGVWSHTEECGHGTYYTYTVTTSVGTQTTTDPYAKSAGLNGNRSMVIDMSLTNPEGWDADKNFSTGIDNYTDATIWEVHVRDFSNKISASEYKGKYLAFTERGLVNSSGIPVGVDYLVELGITHVHLLPVYDYATVDEANPDASFNWGYDPKNYNVPEGSYSTDPTNGAVRVAEFKQMVQSLHDAGIGVIMDVVYNHTYDANSSFNKIVPYYYYRYTSMGTNSSASGCGNDTASERHMFGKFMVDSVTYWLTEYNLDGFRFDLMGLHDLQTIKEVEAAVHAIDPDAIIYGEGWTMGSTTDGSAQANQSNISQIKPTNSASGSVAVFNDIIRDGIKGSTFDKTSGGYINGNNPAGNRTNIKFGIAGGSLTGFSWKVQNAMVINYISAHDNHTLWDKLELTSGSKSIEERLAMNRLGAAIVMISQGTPFMQAGEEMLRTKDGDENSYKSGDDINNIDWEALTSESNEYKTMLYYKGLIEMRQTYGIFTKGKSVAVSFTDLEGGALAAKFDDHMGGKAVVVINPNATSVSYNLGGEYNLVATGSQAGADTISTADGNITVNGCDIHVYVNNNCK